MEVACNWGMMSNELISFVSKLKNFKYLGSLLTNQHSIHEEIKYILKAGNLYYYSLHWRCNNHLKRERHTFKMYNPV